MDKKLSVGQSDKKPAVTIKKVLIVFGFLGIVIGSLFLLHRVVLNATANLGKQTEASGDHFQILSEPPDTAYVGEEYQYLLRIGQFDSPRVFVTITEKPDWLTWDADKLRLYGTPEDSNIGQNSVVIKATDTDVSKEQAFSIFVEEIEVGNVQGAEDTITRNPDNEVVATDSCQRYYEDLGPLGILNEHPECEGVYYTSDNDEDVLGANDVVDGIIDNVGVIPTVSASRVTPLPNLFGIKMSKSLEMGVIASSAVVILSISMLLIWIGFTSIRSSKLGKGEGKNSKSFNLGNQREGRQQSFLDKKDQSQVIIWD